MIDIADVLSADATTQAELLRNGEIGALELLDAAIARIEALDPTINAVITPLFDKAREQVNSGAIADGSFRGVPMVLKDFACHSAGDPFYEGMRYLRDLGWTEPDDTELAARFRAAGFVFVGKTNTCELGMVPDTQPTAFGPTRNPWSPDRSPLGSSGGSAAAVASGMVAVGHANDGGGSIRLPASACGLVGLKPSRARVPAGPEFGDLIGGFVAEHVVTRSVRDAAAVLDAVAGPQLGDPYAAPPLPGPLTAEVDRDPGRLRIALMRTHARCEVDPSCTEAVDRTAALLESLRHHVEVGHPPEIDDSDIIDVCTRQFAAGTAWVIDRYWPQRTGVAIAEGDVERITWRLAEIGRAQSGGDYLADRERVQCFTRHVAQWMDDSVDLLLTPTSPHLPHAIGEHAPVSTMYFTMPFNATGQPAISVPMHSTPDGRPVGVQLVAPSGREDALVRVAGQLERAQPWPPIAPTP